MRLPLLCLLAAPALMAQPAPASPPVATPQTTTQGHANAVPVAVAARRTGPVALDAKLDDAAWAAANPITQFTQQDPDEGKPPTQRTEVRFLYDDDALYVGARMYDTAGARGVTTRLVRRDASFDSDFFQLVIDSYHDHLSRAFFEVNPAGSKSDAIGIGTSCCDYSWDPVWEAVTSIDSEGWTAEIRIPYSQLRFSQDSVQSWGLQVRRIIKRRDEQQDWSFWRKNEAGGPSRFGHLDGLRIRSQPAGLELMPYASAKSESFASEVGSPFDSRSRPRPSVGLDARYRLTSNLTLNATINPDFGQVEVDPAVLNLSAFETFFPEKRPFFVEGAQVFNFGSFSCHFCSNVEGMSALYSRRVGRAPTGAGLAFGNYDYADVPEATTILGAAKLTGRTQKGFTIGIMDAVTSRATARVQDIGSPATDQLVEPLSNFFVGRVKRDFNNGNLVVGGVVSGVQRNLDDTFAPRLADHAEMYGNDVQWTSANKKYSFAGSAAVTNVFGDPRAIAIRQRSSARYFQRPDRGAGSGGFLSNRYDTTTTSLHGLGAYARFAKETGDWWWETSANTRTPGYETNDFAFQRNADYTWYNANLVRYFSKPGPWYQTIYSVVGGQQQHNYSGDRTGTQLHAYAGITTKRFWNFNQFIIERPRAVDDKLLRGGPAVIQPANHFVNFDMSTNSRHVVRADGGLSYFWDELGGTNPSTYVNVTYRPVSNLSLTSGPSWSASRSMRQYVDAVEDPTATAFYGSRYVLATLDQRVLGLDTRVSWTFSPTMTLELFAQPFFASGHFFDFKEYATPRTVRPQVYGRDVGAIRDSVRTNGVVAWYRIDPDGGGPASEFEIGNPDFSDHSLRGNAVFRWEYRPGSVLYVAWTHSRFGETEFGNLNFSRDRDALFAVRPDNIFLVKASYWLPF
jgi:hypothetical protein